MAYLGGRLQGGPNFSLTAFLLAELFAKFAKILLIADGRQF